MRVIRAAVAALFFYLLYYFCQFLCAFFGFSRNAVVITVLGSALFLGAVAFILVLGKKNILKELHITKITAGDIFELLFLGVAFNIACVIIMAMIPFPQTWIDGYVNAASDISGNGIVLDAVFTLLVAPVTEEVLFRGLVYGNLTKGINKYIAALITAALFGWAHGQIIWILYASLLGLVMIWVYETYRSLTASLLFHLGFNLIGHISSSSLFTSEFYVILFLPSLAYIGFIAVKSGRRAGSEHK